VSEASPASPQRALPWRHPGPVTDPPVVDVAPPARLFWSVVVAVLAMQGALLVLYSWYQYERFDLREDFAHNAQAWYLIGHGYFSPYDTVRIPTTLFVRDHADFILWPLSLLHYLSSSPFSLLVVQDLAIVLAELVTMCWIWQLLRTRLERHQTPAGVLALVMLVSSAWWYETVSFDIHMPPLGLPVVLFMGYALWREWWGRAIIAALGSVLFGAPVVELAFFVGLASLITVVVRPPRRTRNFAIAAGVSVFAAAWVVGVSGLGADQASNVSSQFSYLTGRTGHVGLFGIIKGALEHPNRILEVMRERAQAIARILLNTGWIGILSPVGLLVAIGTLVPAGLASSPVYSSGSSAFQTLPVVPFVLIGAVMVLLQLTAWGRLEPDDPNRVRLHTVMRWIGRPLCVCLLAAVVAASSLFFDVRLISQLRRDWWSVSAPAAQVLDAQLRVIPTSAEVVASDGIVGRFSLRRYIYGLGQAGQTIPVRAKVVYFVIAPDQGNELLSVGQSDAALAFITNHLHAQTVINTDGIHVLRWRPATTAGSVRLPV
jgi:uncharacterized membrane protein